MGTPATTSSSFFSLLRFRLPEDRYQDLAIVFHQPPNTARTNDSKRTLSNQVHRNHPPLSLHLGAGDRSWRSDYAADPDACTYSRSPSVVQARPCDGLMRIAARPPTWPRRAPKHTLPREWRTQSIRLLFHILFALLVFVITLRTAMDISIRCSPIVNPNGACQVMLGQVTKMFNDLSNSSSARLSSEHIFPISISLSPSSQPSPSPSATAKPPARAQFVVLDTVDGLMALLATYHDRIQDPSAFLFQRLSPFLVDIIREGTSPDSSQTNPSPHPPARGNPQHTLPRQQQEEEEEQRERDPSGRTQLRALASSLEVLQTEQSTTGRQLKKHLDEYWTSWVVGRTVRSGAFAWSATGGRPWVIEQADRQRELERMVSSRNTKLFASFRARVGCPARLAGDHHQEGGQNVLTRLRKVVRGFDAVADRIDEVKSLPEVVVRQRGTAIALEELLRRGDREARAGADVARGAIEDLQHICSNLYALSEKGWKSMVGEGAKESHSHLHEGVRELWMTWPSDNDAIDILQGKKESKDHSATMEEPGTLEAGRV
ncbi:hypothetical protein F4782DRAFT_551839 [Xylaria castorea]|nr:hypothetical protein F4782DRAFT_551839 [Xylaria castorea]